MGVALGKETEDEYKKDLHKVTARLRGDVGILFTDKTADEVVQFFNDYSQVRRNGEHSVVYMQSAR